MSNFEGFSEKFKSHYGNDIYKFIDDFYHNKVNPLNGEHKEDLDVELYDSYGSEDSILERVVYFGEFDTFVKFEGTRQSYSGEEWTHMTEVKPITKEVKVYEEVNSTGNN